MQPCIACFLATARLALGLIQPVIAARGLVQPGFARFALVLVMHRAVDIDTVPLILSPLLVCLRSTRPNTLCNRNTHSYLPSHAFRLVHHIDGKRTGDNGPGPMGK